MELVRDMFDDHRDLMDIIQDSARKWLCLAKINEMAHHNMRLVDEKTDAVMNKLPSLREAQSIVEQEIPLLLQMIGDENPSYEITSGK
jgi:hypothetical protein